MDINTKAFQDAVMDGNFATFNQEITPAALQKSGVVQALTPVFTAIDDAIGAGKLIQAQLTITSAEPTIIRFETGIINLPFADAKKIINFLEPEELVPLRLYLIVVSPHVNVSGLRIDQIATLDDYNQTKTAQQAAIVTAVEGKLAEIEANAKAPKPEPVAAKPAAKASTRKTTAKKTTRKPAAKKATTRRATAKKATTRKSTTKQTKA